LGESVKGLGVISSRHSWEKNALLREESILKIIYGRGWSGSGSFFGETGKKEALGCVAYSKRGECHYGEKKSFPTEKGPLKEGSWKGKKTEPKDPRQESPGRRTAYKKGSGGSRERGKEDGT